MPMRLFCARPPIWRVRNSCAPRVDAFYIDRPRHARESLGLHTKMESALPATTRARMVLLVGIGKASMRMGSASNKIVSQVVFKTFLCLVFQLQAVNEKQDPLCVACL